MRSVAELLWGPRWIVMFKGNLVYRSVVVRAKSKFYAKWKAALKVQDDPQVGYIAFKWMNGLMLDENEQVKAQRAESI